MDDDLAELLTRRFGGERSDYAAPPGHAAAVLGQLAGHRVHRAFDETRPVPSDLMRTIVACALSAPSKSDLQQRDIVILTRDVQDRIADAIPHMPWIRGAPGCVVVCINGRRLTQLFEWRERPFPNDHFDLLFNGIGDAAIALAWLVAATEAAGLVGCPVSEIRNFAEDISDWLDLPDRVVPFAAYCFGWAKGEAPLSPRLPLAATVHHGGYDDADARSLIAAYDARREAVQPFAEQRDIARWGISASYGWSEEKARQYAVTQREGFGAFVRSRGFRTE